MSIITEKEVQILDLEGLRAKFREGFGSDLVVDSKRTYSIGVRAVNGMGAGEWSLTKVPRSKRDHG